ncbi:MAG: hypothetical protein J6Y89_01185 [Lachnospiraceae bacterium]|nr:hypothetical protein [Lachnospiraceae bacterium]
MAGIYHKYSVTQSGSLSLGYVCSKCGKKQIINASIQGFSSTNDRGFVTKNGVDRRIERAKSDALTDLDAQMEKAKQGIARNDYRSLNLNHACESCGHREMWSNMYSAVLLFAMLAVIIIEVGVLFVIIFGKHSFAWLLPGIAAFACVFLLYHLLAARKNRLVQKIPKEKLPRLITDEKMLRYYTMSDEELQEIEKISSANREVIDINGVSTSVIKSSINYPDWICKNCGETVTGYHSYCTYCGKGLRSEALAELNKNDGITSPKDLT